MGELFEKNNKKNFFVDFYKFFDYPID